MIETIMLSALGFLVSTVLWLLLLPAISRRADKLARRRAELTFPLSVDEISAERDHLRAEFAVRQRELERRVEEQQSARSQALARVGGLDMQISELKTTLGVRDLTILDLETNLGETRADLADTRARLAAEEAGHAATREELAVRNQTLAERDAALAALRVERADLSATLASRVKDLAEARADIERLSSALLTSNAKLARLEADHTALEAERRRLATALADSETAGQELASRIADLDARLAVTIEQLQSERAGHATTRGAFEQRGAELAALTAERDSLRQRLKASDDTVARLEQTLTELRSAKATNDKGHAGTRKELEQVSALLRKATEAKAKLEVAAATMRREHDARTEALKADLAAAEEAASLGRGERSALKQELSQLRRDAERAAQRLDAENAQLRAEILKVADQFLGLREPPRRPAIEQDKAGPVPAAAKTAIRGAPARRPRPARAPVRDVPGTAAE